MSPRWNWEADAVLTGALVLSLGLIAVAWGWRTAAGALGVSILTSMWMYINR